MADDGFAHVGQPCSNAEFVALAHAFGEVVHATPVRVLSGKRTYLASPNPIPFHTDHPKADLIAWRCEAQDARDGASLLVDGYEVLDDLDMGQRAGLERLVLPAMIRLGDEALPTPILTAGNGRPHLFYAPWLEPIGRPVEVHGALVAFRDALDRHGETTRSVRLEPGEVLVIDNHRMLHGRGALLPDSARRLRRFWIRTASPVQQT